MELFVLNDNNSRFRNYEMWVKLATSCKCRASYRIVSNVYAIYWVLFQDIPKIKKCGWTW